MTAQAMFSSESEHCVIGALLRDNNAVDFIGALTAEHFFLDDCRKLFVAAMRMIGAGRGCDAVTLAEELFDRNDGDDWLPIIGDMVANTPSSRNVGRYAQIVIDRATERALVVASDTIAMIAGGVLPTAEKVDKAQATVMALADGLPAKEARDISSILADVVQAVQDGLEGSVVRNLSGWTDVDSRADLLTPGDLIIVAARPAMGKAQPLDAKIKTLSGWTTMGDISVGDSLASIDGRESVVSGVYPQGQKQIFKVVFSDGRGAECCAEHLWSVMHREWNDPRVLTTERLVEMLQCVRYKNRLWINCVSGDFGLDDELPIHPWVLGAMLGDGTFSESNNGARFSTKSPEIVERMNRLVSPLGVELVHVENYDWRIVGKSRENGKGGRSFEDNGLRAGVKELGLFGTLSDTKFIPKKYLHASKESRIALLQGLLDTDGWIEKWGSIRFSSASKQLAGDVVSLVRSLGGMCSLSEKKTTFSYKGEKKCGMVAYVLCISLNSDLAAFTLDEKTARVRSDWGNTRRVTFQSITPSRTAEAQCIMVSHPSHTYITNDYVVTHNTTFAMNLAEHVAADKPVVVFSQEMGDTQLGTRLVAAVGRVQLERLTRHQSQLTDDDLSRMAMAADKISKFQLHIDDQPARSLHQIRTYCRAIKRKHGDLGLVVIDYLQLMTATEGDNRTEQIGSISRGLKVLAKELQVPVIALSQLNRSLEQRPNKRPIMSDLRESGQIEQDADVIAFIYRDEVYNPDTSDKGIAEIIFGKLRNGQIGTVALAFNGEFSRFDNLAHGWAPAPAAEKKSRGFKS